MTCQGTGACNQGRNPERCDCKGLVTNSTDGAATVDRGIFWIPIDNNAPIGTKVQLINQRDGVAVYGHIRANDCPWTHWAPLPVFKRGDKPTGVRP